MTILITGATGFLGSALVNYLSSKRQQIRAIVRKDIVSTDEKIEYFRVENIDDKTDWSDALVGVKTVVHCAARAHIMNDSSQDPLSEFRKINTHATVKFAKQAAAAGVKKFIFISSIKVNGEFTNAGKPFTPNHINIPSDPYGISKYEAEKGLKKIAKQTGLEIVIIRPPLVYGPNVKANFKSMLKWVSKGVPLPFGSVNNQRSLVALSNLVDFISCCIDHPKAANETFLISDFEDVSTTGLLRKIGEAFGQRIRLIPVPVQLMRVGAMLLGKKDLADRIFGNLQVDASKAEKLLGWVPVVTMEQELKKTIDTYLNEKNI